MVAEREKEGGRGHWTAKLAVTSKTKGWRNLNVTPHTVSRGRGSGRRRKRFFQIRSAVGGKGDKHDIGEQASH